MRTLMIMLMCFPLFSFHCSKKKAIAENNIEQIGDMEENEIPKVNIVRSLPGESDPFNLMEMKIDGKTLTITVQYAHGGKEHQFDLYTNQMMMKSMPPKMNLFLQHQANGDMGKALKTEKLQFDLSPIAAPPGRLILLLNNTEQTVELITEVK